MTSGRPRLHKIHKNFCKISPLAQKLKSDRQHDDLICQLFSKCKYIKKCVQQNSIAITITMQRIMMLRTTCKRIESVCL
jgi:hypothetical protein